MILGHTDESRRVFAMEIYRSRKRVPVQSKNARTLAVVLVLALLAAISLISAATDSRNSLRVT